MVAGVHGTIERCKLGRLIGVQFHPPVITPHCWRRPFVFLIINNMKDPQQSKVMYKWQPKGKGDILMVPASAIDRADTAFYVLGGKHYPAAHYCAYEALKEEDDALIWAAACAVLHIKASKDRPTLEAF